MDKTASPTGKIILIFLVAILLGLIFFTFFRHQFFAGSDVAISDFYARIQRSINPSRADLSFKNEELRVSFKINSADQKNLSDFLRDLRIDDDLNSQDIKIKLGPQTADFINQTLKDNNLIKDDKIVSLNLRFLPDEIDFDNKNNFGFFDDKLEDLLKNPTPWGIIKVQPKGKKGYYILVDNPEKVVFEATISGNLKLSENLTTAKWWQILAKLAKIKIIIDNDSINGTIILK